MRLRAYVILSLVRKDLARLIRNGPALMLLGLFVLVAVLVATSGLVDGGLVDSGLVNSGLVNSGLVNGEATPDSAQQQASQSDAIQEKAWIVYPQDGTGQWIEHLQRRAPKSLGIRFVDAENLEPQQVDAGNYPPGICVIEISKSAFYADRQQIRRRINYRYAGSDPNVLFPVTRWFLSASLEHFGQTPQFFETIEPLALPEIQTGDGATTRAALEDISVADVFDISLIGTSLLTAIHFFAACGLMVSLTAQERERGALRALLLTPASYLEFVASKAMVHGGLALMISTLVVAAIQPAVLTSLLFWGTMIFQIGGYFALGLLIASYAKNQTAPNLLSFAYLLVIGTLNLLSVRFDFFQLLANLTFERYGLVFTITSLNAGGLSAGDSLNVMQTPAFGMLMLLSISLLMIATAIGSQRLRA